jgi:hypothetical protein
MSSPRRTKETMPYPAFPVKGPGKGRRNFPAEDPKDFKVRVEVMAAYLRSLTKIAARFKEGRKFFMYGGNKVDRRAVNNLYSQLGADIRDLSGYYKAAKTKSKTRTGLGGFALPNLASQKMVDFLKGADLGAVYNADGTTAGQDLRTALPFLTDQGYNGVVGGGVLMALMSIYNMSNNLTGRATTNRQLAAQGQPLDGNWLGVDPALAGIFAQEIVAGVEKGQQRLIQEQAAGGGEGQPQMLNSKGQRGKPVERLKNGKYRSTQLFYAFNPENFRWSDFSTVFVTPNVSKETFRNVNPNADLFFPPGGVSATQAAQISAYDTEISALKDAGNAGSIDHITVAVRAANVGTVGELSAANAPLFARAQNSSTQQLATNSKKGLKIALKTALEQSQGQA